MFWNVKDSKSVLQLIIFENWKPKIILISMNNEKFIFCLEAIPDSAYNENTPTLTALEQLAMQGIDSIYNFCDGIEEFEERLGHLLYDDSHFKEYEIIYLVMNGADNKIELNDYYYSLEEVAELFEGKMKGKIIHFSNTKSLDLTQEEAQYFLDVSGARAVSGYGMHSVSVHSLPLDQVFFSLCQDEHDLKEVVELMHERHYVACKALDFRLYY